MTYIPVPFASLPDRFPEAVAQIRAQQGDDARLRTPVPPEDMAWGFTYQIEPDLDRSRLEGILDAAERDAQSPAVRADAALRDQCARTTVTVVAGRGHARWAAPLPTGVVPDEVIRRYRSALGLTVPAAVRR